MWQDVVGRALLRQGGSDPMQVDDGAVDEAEDSSHPVLCVCVIYFLG